MTALRRLTLLQHGLAIGIAGGLFPLFGWILYPTNQQTYALWFLAFFILAVVCLSLKNYVAKNASAAERVEARAEGYIK